MAFLSVYNDTKRVFVGDPDRGYWVELREHVSQGGREAAERALTTMVVVDGKTIPKPDVTRFRQLTILASIADWNLNDDDGTVWPVTLRSVQRLPGVVFDQLWGEVDSMSTPRSTEEAQKFRDGDVSGDPNGDTGAPSAEHLSD